MYVPNPKTHKPAPRMKFGVLCPLATKSHWY